MLSKKLGLRGSSWVAISILSLTALSACGGGGGGDSTTPPPSGGGGSTTTDNSAVATPSTTGTVSSLAGGGSSAVTVTFTSSDAKSLTNLSVTSDLGASALPAGWTAPSTFSCASVTTGSGCVLNLAYAPTAVATGTLTLNYSYTNNAGTAKTGSIGIPYAATTANNVVVAVSPSGQIQALVNGGSQAVNLSFTTDDSNPVSSLQVTSDLGALPGGWTASANPFTCATVSPASGCSLTLTYAPTATASGTLTINYQYNDNSGTQKTGVANIAYTATAANNVSGATTPSGQIATAVNGSQAVSVAFTTDNSQPATAFSITSNLASLPAGWSTTAGTSFTCASVTGPTSCVLPLTFAPTTGGSGTLTLNYGYTDGANAAKTGSLNIPYVGTTNNNVNSSRTPSGTVSAVVANSQTVTVTFNTDDANSATALSVTSDLTALPAGWTTTASTFTCSTVQQTGTTCQLPLTYAPTAAASATLTVNYGYTSNSGVAKTGSVSIPYVATVAHAYVANGTGGVVVCTLNINGALTNCASTGSGFSNPSGIAFYGSEAYVANNTANTVSLCDINGSGGLVNCASAGGSFAGVVSLATFSNGTLYATRGDNNITACDIDVSNQLANCGGIPATTSAFITGIHVGTNKVYLAGSTEDKVYVCGLGPSGGVSSCVSTGSGFENPYSVTISPDGTRAYVTNFDDASVSVCTVGSGGGLSSCAKSSTHGGTPIDVEIFAGRAYVTDAGGVIDICPINASTGLFTSCNPVSGGATFAETLQIVIR